MKHLKIVLFTLFILTVGSLKAQINLRPGYIITNTNDTITGFIDFRTDQRNAQQCFFKEKETGNVTTYHPGEIYAYRFTDDGKFYITRTLTIREKEHTLFLEYIIQGIISLYYYFGDKAYYFFELEDGNMIEISQQHDNRIVVADGKKGYKQDLRYIGKLNYVFKKSPKVQKKTSQLQLGKYALADLTKTYHYEICETGEKCIQFESLKDKKFITLSYTPTVGIKHHTYTSKGMNLSWALDKMQSLSPAVGIDVKLNIPRWSRLVGANVALDISKLKGKQDRLPSRNYYNKLDVDAYVIDNRIGLYFNLPLAKVRPFIEAGYYQNYLAGLEIIATTESIENETVREHKYDYAKEVSPFFWGFYGKIGVDILLKRHSLLLYGYYQKGKNSDSHTLQTAGVTAGFTF